MPLAEPSLMLGHLASHAAVNASLLSGRSRRTLSPVIIAFSS